MILGNKVNGVRILKKPTLASKYCGKQKPCNGSNVCENGFRAPVRNLGGKNEQEDSGDGDRLAEDDPRPSFQGPDPQHGGTQRNSESAENCAHSPAQCITQSSHDTTKIRSGGELDLN